MDLVPRIALDLTRYHFKRELGDITLFGTWFLASDSGPKPCLVLLPTGKQNQHGIPCVVPQNQAWVWSEAIGDARRAAQTAYTFAEHLGLDSNNPSNVFRIRSIIHDHILDLLHIPPMPMDMRERVPLGEVTVRDREGDQLVRHEEVFGGPDV